MWVGLPVHTLNSASELSTEHRTGFFSISLSCSGKAVVKAFHTMSELLDEVVGTMIREV